MIVKKINRKLWSMYATMLFGNRIHVFGKFKLGNRKNITIGKNSKINYDVYILGRHNVIIGERVTLSARVMIFDSGLDITSLGTTSNVPHIESFVRIEDDVWIGAGAIILPGVTIQRNSVVAAGSIVTKDVPSFTIVGGNPAKILKQISPEE